MLAYRWVFLITIAGMFDCASIGWCCLYVQSAGAVTMRLSAGWAIGRSPGFSSRAKNWLKVSQPLGALGRHPVSPLIIESRTAYFGDRSMKDCSTVSLNDAVVSRKLPQLRA